MTKQAYLAIFDLAKADFLRIVAKTGAKKLDEKFPQHSSIIRKQNKHICLKYILAKLTKTEAENLEKVKKNNANSSFVCKILNLNNSMKKAKIKKSL